VPGHESKELVKAPLAALLVDKSDQCLLCLCQETVCQALDAVCAASILIGIVLGMVCLVLEVYGTANLRYSSIPDLVSDANLIDFGLETVFLALETACGTANLRYS